MSAGIVNWKIFLLRPTLEVLVIANGLGLFAEILLLLLTQGLIGAVSAQLWPPKMLTRSPHYWWFLKKDFDVMLHLEAEWPLQQNILI